MARILAIDYGKKRTGLAVTDVLRITANPLLTVETSELREWLSAELSKGEIDQVVIGRPTRLDGSDSESSQYIKPFVEWFRKSFSIPLAEYDERFTSTLAHRAMIDGGMKKKDRRDKAVVDKIAACIILEGYLDSLNGW